MNIAVYCGSRDGNDPAYIEGAKKLGLWIGSNGHTLVYGGSDGGLMGTVANAVLDAGGRVIGVQPRVDGILSRRHERITEYIMTDTVAERRSKMIELSDAFIALPGGVGTLDEISEVISLASLSLLTAPIVFFNTLDYYEPLKRVFDGFVNTGFASSEYFDKIAFTDDLSIIEAVLG